MDDWVIWLIAAVVLGVGEIASMGFFLAPFAGGALVAALVAGLGGGQIGAWAAFIVVSLVLLGALRPLARRRLPPQLRTGTAALVGRTATVVSPIDHGAGAIRLDGETWTARPLDDDQRFAEGERVQVVEIRGATALVTD